MCIVLDLYAADGTVDYIKSFYNVHIYPISWLNGNQCFVHVFGLFIPAKAFFVPFFFLPQLISTMKNLLFCPPVNRMKT